MLEHLSPKFRMPPVEREPRAALILNRFTRNLTVMFATNAITSVLGLAPEQIKDKSFYRCIQERCLPDALNCLESAKANDSIAYLRFWSRDPRDEDDDDQQNGNEEEDHHMDDAHSSPSDSDEGGAALDGHMDVDGIKREEEEDPNMDSLPSASGQGSSSLATSRSGSNRAPLPADINPQQNGRRRRRRQPLPSIELEAVVSCTSDGLVVILRRARPAIPPSQPASSAPSPWTFENGLFAAPWAQQPIRPYVPPEMIYTFRAPLMPQFMPLRENVKEAGGPPMDHLMRSIRDVAVFAWALVGINGNFASYTHGRPRDEAAPPEGLPIWDPTAVGSIYQPPENQAAAKWAARAAAIPQSLQPPGGGYYHTASSSASAAYAQNMYTPAGHGYNPIPRQHHQYQQQEPRPPLSGSTVVPEGNNSHGYAVPRAEPEQPPREYDPRRWQ